MPSPNTNAQHAVTAVIVAHDGAAWIPHVTEALLSQTRPVDRVVAVDTGSRDRSGAMLAEALGRGAVFGMDRGVGYGAAVHQALRHRAANTHLPPVPGASAERVEWVWLLHDDCEPESDALEQLLAEAAQAPGTAVLGPKVMDFSDRDVLLEAGLAIDRVGRRITGIEPREMDQGQHDGDRDVFAVGSAGMLVRRDVWERVGGFDPAMRLYREDVDFCWRVLAAGHRVRLVTDAVVYHAEAATRNRRAASAARRRERQDRRNGLLVLAGNLPLGPMLSSLAGSFVLSLLRTAFFLLAKRPGAALDETAAYLSVAGHPLRLMAARRQRARGRRQVYGRVRADIPPGRSFRKLAEYASVALSKSHQAEMVGSHHATEDPSDDDSLLVDSGVVQRLLANPGVLLFLGLTVVALAATRSLLGSSPLGGGALMPAWGGASGLWQEYLQGFHPVGIGTAASTPPYVALLAALATLLGGKPWLAVDVILIGCVPFAGATAYLASRRATTFVPARVWGALSYALLPVGMGAVASGRLGAAVVLVLLPLVGLLAARVFTQPPRRARRAAWAMGLVVAVAAAFVPLIWLVAALAMGLGLLAVGRRRPVSPLNAAIVVLVPPVLLAPWTADLLLHPSQLFLEAGLQPSGLASSALPARWLLLLWPGGPGLPPPWVTGGLAVAAVAALLAGARRALVLAGWGVALIGLLVASAVSRIVAAPAAGGPSVPAWPGVALAVAGAGLVLAAAAAAESMPGVLRSGGWRSPRGLAALALAAVACSAPVLAAVSWVGSGVSGPVAPSAGPLLPEVIQVYSGAGARVRTLVLRAAASGAVDYSVLRASDPLIGSSELATPPAAQHALDVAVAALTAPSGRDIADQGRTLAGFGIGYVLMPAPVDARLAHVLDGVAGLRTVSQTSSFELWQVADTAARVTVVEPDGAVVAVPSGTTNVSGARVPAAGGTLVLAEPEGGWSASLNGRPLAPLAAPVDGWAQGFRLPSGGGQLTVSRDETARDLAIGLEGLAALVVAALGLPGARVAGEAEAAGVAAGGRRQQGRREAGEAGAEDVAAEAAGGGDAEGERAGAGAPRGAGRGRRDDGRREAGRRKAADARDGREGRSHEKARDRGRGKRMLRGGRAGEAEAPEPRQPVTARSRGEAAAAPPVAAGPSARPALRGEPGLRRAAGRPPEAFDADPRAARRPPGAFDPDPRAAQPGRGSQEQSLGGQEQPGVAGRRAPRRGGPERGAPGRRAAPDGYGRADRDAAPEWDAAAEWESRPVREPGGRGRPGLDPLAGRGAPAGYDLDAQRGRPGPGSDTEDRPTSPGRRRRPAYGPTPDPGALGRGAADRGAPRRGAPAGGAPGRGASDYGAADYEAAGYEAAGYGAAGDGVGRGAARRGVPGRGVPGRGRGAADFGAGDRGAPGGEVPGRDGADHHPPGRGGRRRGAREPDAREYDAPDSDVRGRGVGGRGIGGRGGVGRPGGPGGPGVPRGRLPGDATLPPLPPLPSRPGRPRRSGQPYPPDDGGPAEWDGNQPHDVGESDW